MDYKIEFSSKSKKFIKKLQKNFSLRILDKFKEVSKNPFRFLEHYEGDNCFKLRIGNYRALIDVDFQHKILKVRIIDKRGRIYKR
jgi:mRNA-degrading endonuclease RelE of RelBE toxin-antitoxin system